MSRTFETPSFTVGVCGTVGLAVELLHTRDRGQCAHTSVANVDVRKPAHLTHENNKRKEGFALNVIPGSVQKLLVSWKKVLFCHSTLKQLPNYRNSLGMRPNFRFVFTVYGSAQVGGRRGKNRVWAKESERRGEGGKKKEQISPTSGHFPICWPSVMM